MTVLPALALAAAVAAQAPAPPPDAALQAQLATIAAAHHGKVALFARNLSTGQTAALDPDEPVPTASVIKLAALYEAMEQLRAGELRWDEKLTLTKADQVQGSGVLVFLDTPATLTVKDALTLMVTVSDNTATNLVLGRLGLARVNARMRSIGLTQTTFYKKVFKPIEGPIPPEQPQFGLGRTTAREMAELMTRIVRCRFGPGDTAPTEADRAVCSVALEMLRNQSDRLAIPRYLETVDSSEAGSAIAHKTGAVDAARNDVAALATPNGTIVLSIFTHDNADHGWSVDDEGDLTIARLARCVVQAWSPRGLDASKGF
ncbi:MAG: serine hydrolase [Proteobacteria bacterium]|nr:serine hydrolase [Pseudomonadota bacterium]